MNKKVVVPFLVVLMLALLVAAVVYAPNFWELMLRMHGMR